MSSKSVMLAQAQQAGRGHTVRVSGKCTSSVSGDPSISQSSGQGGAQESAIDSSSIGQGQGERETSLASVGNGCGGVRPDCFGEASAWNFDHWRRFYGCPAGDCRSPRCSYAGSHVAQDVHPANSPSSLVVEPPRPDDKEAFCPVMRTRQGGQGASPGAPLSPIGAFEEPKFISSYQSTGSSSRREKERSPSQARCKARRWPC